MALTATYEPILSRVRLSATLLGATATYAVFDYTTDGIRYTTARGGTHTEVLSQGSSVDVYEFPAGIPVTYRVRSYSVTNVLQQTFTVVATQDLGTDAIWLKVPAAPYLNRQVVVSTVSELTTKSRAGLHDVIGRTYPVAVGDVRSALAFTATLRTLDAAQESDLEYLLSSGEIVFIHTAEAERRIRGGYYSVGDVSWRAPHSQSVARVFTLPLTEVAPPGPDVVGSSYSWQAVINDYATWADLLADNATWAALLERTGSPSDVVVS
jgi:hypothetical protein